MAAAEVPAVQARQARVSGVLFALLSASGFAVLGLFAKLIYREGFAVQQALAWRFTVAALFLWMYLFLSGKYRHPRGQYWRLALLGLFGFAPQAGLYFLTVSYLEPGLTSLLLYLYPAFVIIFGILFLKRKPGLVQLAALVLSITGCVLTFWTRGDYPMMGYVLGVTVAVAYAGYILVTERVLIGIDPVFATTVIMTVAAALYWLLSLAGGVVRFPQSIEAIGGILGVAVISTILPVIALFAALKRIGSADASLVSTVEPLITICVSALLLGERLGSLQLAGGACILAALLVLNVRRGRKTA